jgi:PIN domain nuclease of toxin-antitoxin system
VVIKRALGRTDFRIDPRLLRRLLVENGYVELAVTSDHALAADRLPPLHRDPFDRLLVAQALAEGLSFITADAQLSAHPGDIRTV